MATSFIERFKVNRKSVLTPTFWNSLMQEINAYFSSVDDLKATVSDLQSSGIQAMLDRINEVIVPAAERINKIAELGFLAATSETSVTVADGASVEFIIDEGDQRELFIPGAFVAVTRASTPDDYSVARVTDWNKSTGVLVVEIITVVGAAGPFTDWVIVSSPAIVTAQAEFINAAEAAATASASSASAADGFADAAAASAVSAAASAATATGAVDDVREIIAPPGVTPPATPSLGQMWYDTNAVRVYDGSGFVPAVSASLGGMSFQSGTFGASPSGVITIGGGFTSVMVFKNGALLRDTAEYTAASPTVTILSPVNGDKWFVWAYKANDATDYYTKTEANGLLADKLNSASYTAADVLSKVKTVDGSGSGLDADTVDGIEGPTSAGFPERKPLPGKRRFRISSSMAEPLPAYPHHFPSRLGAPALQAWPH